MELYDKDPANYVIEGDTVKAYRGSSSFLFVPAGVKKLGIQRFRNAPFDVRH